MNRKFFAGIIMVAACGTVMPTFAADPELCLDCHEPAEDWEGMSAAEIMAQAKDTSIKRHKDNADLTDEQLTKMIAELMPQ